MLFIAQTVFWATKSHRSHKQLNNHVQECDFGGTRLTYTVMNYMIIIYLSIHSISKYTQRIFLHILLHCRILHLCDMQYTVFGNILKPCPTKLVLRPKLSQLSMYIFPPFNLCISTLICIFAHECAGHKVCHFYFTSDGMTSRLL